MHLPPFPIKIRRRAFTLIELLAVVGVIAILATLLVPGISHIMHKSRQAQSVSNLRQIGAAFFLYVSDNGGQTPGQGQNTMFVIDSEIERSNNNRLLHLHLRPYLSDSQEVWRSGTDDTFFHKYHNGTATSYGHALGDFAQTPSGSYAYATNSVSIEQMQENATRGASRRPLFAEADWEIRMPQKELNGSPLNDTFHVLFLDGRVGQYARTMVQGRYRSDW